MKLYHPISQPSRTCWLVDLLESRYICPLTALSSQTSCRANKTKGTLCHVSGRYAQGDLLFRALLWLCAQSPQTRLQILKPAEGGLYTGMHQAFWKIRRIEGFRSMWKGVSSVIVGAGMLCVLLWRVRSNDVYRSCACPLLLDLRGSEACHGWK